MPLRFFFLNISITFNLCSHTLPVLKSCPVPSYFRQSSIIWFPSLVLTLWFNLVLILFRSSSLFLSNQAYWGKRYKNFGLHFPLPCSQLYLKTTIDLSSLCWWFYTYKTPSPVFCFSLQIFTPVCVYLSTIPSPNSSLFHHSLTNLSTLSNLLQLQTNDKGSRLQILFVPSSSHSRTTSAFCRFVALSL